MRESSKLVQCSVKHKEGSASSSNQMILRPLFVLLSQSIEEDRLAFIASQSIFLSL